MERRRPGPKPKGVRRALTVRVPVDHAGIYEEAAARAGLAVGDYLAVALASGHGLPVPPYIGRNRNQQELRLGA